MTPQFLNASTVLEESPYGKFLKHCARGELAYQKAPDGSAIFYPRAVDCPWEISSGRGEIYSRTIVRHKDEPPFVLALVQMEEGFRLMARVDADEPQSVKIGDRVRVTFRPLAEGQPPLPVFVPEGTR